MLDSSGPRGNGEKREGYVQALAEAGIALDASLVLDPGGSSVGHGCIACARLLALPERPTALFADNDSLALGALRACQLAGVAVPDDLAIVGFDNIEFAEYATTPLSSVNYAVRHSRAARRRAAARADRRRRSVARTDRRNDRPRTDRTGEHPRRRLKPGVSRIATRLTPKKYILIFQ